MKIYIAIFAFFVSVFCLLVVSCKHEVEAPSDVGYSFFPAKTGSWIIYDVDSTEYDGFTHTVKKYSFQLKEKVESVFQDNQNRETMRIERYIKENDSIGWVLRNVWISNLTNTTAERVEENLRFVKLTFPVAAGKTWDGNVYNTLGEQEYSMKNIDKPFSISGKTYDSTLTVVQIGRAHV